MPPAADSSHHHPQGAGAAYGHDLRKGKIPMRPRFTSFIIFFIIAAIVTVPCSAFAENSADDDNQITMAKMTTDVVLVRPLSFVGTVLGFGVFIIAAPFAAMGGNTKQAWNTMVAKPAKFTFARPLGDFK
jgi:small basic protein